MAGPIGSNYYNTFIKQQIQFVTRDDELIVNEKGFRLLV